VDERSVEGACVVGVGACEADGLEACEDGEVLCTANPGEPTPERCNDLDDDCDSETDEDLDCNGDPGPGLPLNFPGVNLDLDLQRVLDGGFALCYSDLYDAEIDEQSLLRGCGRGTILMACRAVDEPDRFTVAAMGQRREVFREIPCDDDDGTLHNSVRWYFTPDCSMGFGPSQSPLDRSICDTSNVQSAERLCWHTVDVGGYRCGAREGLNRSGAWEQLVFHR
jgi:hypothetical protein